MFERRVLVSLRLPGLVSVLLTIILAMAACGGSTRTSATPSPTPTGNTPSPVPSGGGSPSATLFQASVFSSSGLSTIVGSVTVAQSGAGTVALSGLMAGTAYTFRFCPFESGAVCNNISTLNTDAAGASTASFTMSKGTYSGIFQITQNGVDSGDTDFNIDTAGSTYSAQLVPYPGPASAPFGGGDVTVKGSTAHFDVKGLAPGTVLGFVFCSNGGGSGCYFLANETADGSGNGSWDIDLRSAIGTYNAPGAFTAASNPGSNLRLASGFTIP